MWRILLTDGCSLIKRADLYSLTKKGKALMEEHLEESNRLFLNSFGNLQEADQMMAEAMEKLLAVLKKFPSTRERE